MASRSLENAVAWLLEPEHIKEFRQDFDTILGEFPDLDADDIQVLRSIHAKGFDAPEMKDIMSVEGQDAGRSHGW